MLLAWLLLALLGPLVFVGWLLLWRARRPVRRPAPPRPTQALVKAPPGARLPIVLLHGLFGFDEIRVAKFRIEYFRGVRERLVRAGNDVHLVRLPPFAPVEERARCLARAIDGLPTERVNIIAHSMGGLDARVALNRMGLADRVASLVTIGTPHRGTPLADWPALLSNPALRRWLRAVGFDPAILHDLATHRCHDVADAHDVFYGCVLGSVTSLSRERALLTPLHRWLSTRAGDNDVLVPVSSQRWGEVMAEIDADHWAQVGWSQSFDAGALYEGIAQDLRTRGF